jgi:autotransporter-associated beta strand protein
VKPSWCRPRTAGLVLACAALPALWLPGTGARADTLTWTGLALPVGNPAWSNPLNWSPAFAPEGQSVSDSLVFPQTSASTENDVRSDFRLGRLEKTFPTGTVTLAGLSLAFGGSAPTIFVTGGTLDISNALTGPADLVKTGIGKLVLRGDGRAFAGDLRLEVGDLQTAGVGPLGAGTRVLMNAGTRFDIGALGTFGGFSGDGRISLGTSTSVDHDADATFAGSIDGPGGLRKGGSGTFTMTGRSTAQGMTQIDAGAFVLSGSAATWRGSALDIAPGATVRISGGARWDVGSGAVTTGSTRGAEAARLAIENGSHLTSGSGLLGQRAGTTTEVTISGTDAGGGPATWQLSGNLAVGGAGLARLAIGSGGRVVTSGTTTIGAGSRLRLEDGVLETSSVSFAAGSLVDWFSGTLRVTSAADTRFDATAPAALMNLTAGRSLVVEHRLVLGPGATLALNGGSFAGAEIALRGGALATARGRELGFGGVRRLSGAGDVQARFGHVAQHELVAEGGILTLTDTEDTIFAIDGTVRVASSGTLRLVKTRAIELAGTVTLEQDSRLGSSNGLRLVGRASFIAGAGARIEGDFATDTQVQGSQDPARPVAVTGLVSGRGPFTGYIRFEGIHSPGTSTAAAFVEHAIYAPWATLRMEIGGYAPGTQHDVLTFVSAAFAGTLDVQFANGFTPDAGDAFTLMQFASRSGTFEHLAVSGLPSGLIASLDYGARDLVLRVVPVPEPATWGMLGAGMVVVLVRRRCRRAT